MLTEILLIQFGLHTSLMGFFLFLAWKMRLAVMGHQIEVSFTSHFEAEFSVLVCNRTNLHSCNSTGSPKALSLVSATVSKVLKQIQHEGDRPAKFISAKNKSMQCMRNIYVRKNYISIYTLTMVTIIHTYGHKFLMLQYI